MATIPKKGPSLAGPLRSGWTAASLIPQAAVTASLPSAPLTTPTAATPINTPAAPLTQYNLTQEELGTTPNLRVAQPKTTPLEQLLAQMFPDAAADFNPSEIDPLADPRAQSQAPSLFNTILGNLGAQPSAPAAYTQPTFGPPVGVNTGAQLAATIPGAPAFLGNAINNVVSAGIPRGGMAVGAGGPNLAGIAALAAEQRAQAAQLKAEQDAADAAFFQQQAAQQKAQRLAAQRQRQRFGGVNAITSGWASSPVLF